MWFLAKSLLWKLSDNKSELFAKKHIWNVKCMETHINTKVYEGELNVNEAIQTANLTKWRLHAKITVDSISVYFQLSSQDEGS